MKNQFKSAAFVIDSPEDGIFNGYTTAQSWNGWACPHFEYDESVRVLNASGYKWTFADDTFTIGNPDDENDLSYDVSAETIIVNGKGIKTYAIGAGEWTWDEYSVSGQ